MSEKTVFQQQQDLAAGFVERARDYVTPTPDLRPWPVTKAIEQHEESLQSAKGRLHKAIRDAESAAREVALYEQSLSTLRKALAAISET